jgi:MFS family permease
MIGPGGAVGLVLGLGGAAGILVSLILIHLGERSGRWGVLAFVVACGALLSFLPAEAGDISQLIILWMLISGCASAGFALLYRVVVRSAARLSVGLVLSLAILPVNGGMVLGPVIGSILALPEIRGVYPAASALNLLALGVLILASRLPEPGKSEDAG